MKTLILILFIGFLGAASYATSVSVTATTVQQRAGVLLSVYFETANAATGASESVNTALTPPAGTGSSSIAKGTSAYLWSPQFASAKAIPAGSWLLDIWASITTASKATVVIAVCTSTGSVVSTIVSSTSTGTIGTTKGQVATTLGGASVTVPSGDYIRVTLTAPASYAVTLYWGKNQYTDFQVMNSVLSS